MHSKAKLKPLFSLQRKPDADEVLRNKKRIRTIVVFVLLYGCLSLLALSAVSSMVRDNQAPGFPALSQNQIKMVEKAARKLFITGTWHFRESEVSNNVVNLLIEIPSPLDLSVSQQQNYIVQSVCPKLGNPLFRKVNGNQIRIHLVDNWSRYQFDKSQTVAAACG